VLIFNPFHILINVEMKDTPFRSICQPLLWGAGNFVMVLYVINLADRFIAKINPFLLIEISSYTALARPKWLPQVLKLVTYHVVW